MFPILHYQIPSIFSITTIRPNIWVEESCVRGDDTFLDSTSPYLNFSPLKEFIMTRTRKKRKHKARAAQKRRNKERRRLRERGLSEEEVFGLVPTPREGQG